MRGVSHCPMPWGVMLLRTTMHFLSRIKKKLLKPLLWWKAVGWLALRCRGCTALNTMVFTVTSSKIKCSLCTLCYALIHQDFLDRRQRKGVSVLESRCHLPTCLPHTVEASHCPLNCWKSSRKTVNFNFYRFWFDSTANWTQVKGVALL